MVIQNLETKELTFNLPEVKAIQKALEHVIDTHGLEAADIVSLNRRIELFLLEVEK